MKFKKTAAVDLVNLCCRVLDDKKAGDIKILDVSAQSSITDYLILATATSEPHLRALRIDLEKALDSERIHLVGIETAKESGWIVIDAFDVMVHLFLAATRDRYGLERLWRDASEVPLAKVLGHGAPAKPKTKRTRGASTAGRAKPRRKRVAK